MRRIRVTYPGAFHHVMNRGYDGKNIFPEDDDKNHFLELLEEASQRLKIKILPYCVLDNHYHLVLQNTSGRMTDCLKLLNGKYGSYFRKIYGGKGYVFQSRFKSTLIEKESYLTQSIIYLLVNPVRAGMVENAEDYLWSSFYFYFSSSKKSSCFVEVFANELLGTKASLLQALKERTYNKSQSVIKINKFGEFWGSDIFIKKALEKFNRRRAPTEQSIGVQRIDEDYFEPIKKIIMEFEKELGLKISEIDITKHTGKRLRGKLLVYLKDRGGLKYKEIGEIVLFSDLSFASLRSVYRNIKNHHLK